MTDAPRYNINSGWLRDVQTPDARQKRAELVLNSIGVLDLLAAIVTAEIAVAQKTSTNDYDNPNWALKEADRHGQVKALRTVLALTQRTPV